MKTVYGDELAQPPRRPFDGPVEVTHVGEEMTRISVTTAGAESTILMSRHNAWRLFGLLAVMLGIPLPSKLGRLIKM